MKETKEPLAKFQARLDKDGRLVIPRYIRDTLNILQGDYVKVIVRKIQIDFSERVVYVSGQRQVISKVGRKGAVYVPLDVRKQLNIEPDELIEIVLVDFYKSTVSDTNSQFRYIFLDV